MRGTVAKNLRKVVDEQMQQLAMYEARKKHRILFWIFQRLGKFLIKPVSPEMRKKFGRELKKRYIKNRRKK